MSEETLSTQEVAQLGERMRRYRYADRETTHRRSPRLESSTKPLTVPLESSSKRTRSISPVPKAGTSNKSTTKKTKSTGKYVPPSRYSHLSHLVDILRTDLTLVFVGLNPGVTTATEGHAYAHPSNRFWSLLHSSGLTPERKLSPSEDRTLPELYNFGNTNIVERPSKDQSELSKEEIVAGAGRLEEKFRKFRPEAICIVGKGIWEAIWKYKTGKAIKKDEFHYGWQDEQYNMGRDFKDLKWKGSKVFVATSTSGLAASIPAAEREAIWKILGDWVQDKRKTAQDKVTTQEDNEEQT